jgi:hypothetical protein
MWVGVVLRDFNAVAYEQRAVKDVLKGKRCVMLNPSDEVILTHSPWISFIAYEGVQEQ